MRASKNTIYASDVTNLPIKVKYTSSYFCDSVQNTGITISKGVNKPIYSYQKPDKETLIYRLARHMYYTAFLTGSFPVSSSSYEHWMQSTAASGSAEANLRYFPTGANDEITVIAVPRTNFGEKISPTTFRFVISGSATLYDDGNGNIRDLGTGSENRYIDYLYHVDPDQYYQVLLNTSGSKFVGNIFYSQGIVVLYSGSYYEKYYSDCLSCNEPVCGDTFEGYGYLYNWFAIWGSGDQTNGGRNDGGIVNANQPGFIDERNDWRVPSRDDIDQFMLYLDPSTSVTSGLTTSLIAGNLLKTKCNAPFDTNNGLWHSSTVGAQNSLNFSAVPNGSRNGAGGAFQFPFNTINNVAVWWTTYLGSGPPPSFNFGAHNLLLMGESITRSVSLDRFGLGIRLVRPATSAEQALPDGTTSNQNALLPHYVGNSRVYITVKIGDQVWTAQNLIDEEYNDGTPIPEVTDNIAWGILTTGARCSMNNGNITPDQGQIELCGVTGVQDICFSYLSEGVVDPAVSIETIAPGNDPALYNGKVWYSVAGSSNVVVYWDGAQWVLDVDGLGGGFVIQTLDNNDNPLPISNSTYQWTPECLDGGIGIEICSTSVGSCAENICFVLLVPEQVGGTEDYPFVNEFPQTGLVNGKPWYKFQFPESSLYIYVYWDNTDTYLPAGAWVAGSSSNGSLTPPLDPGDVLFYNDFNGNYPTNCTSNCLPVIPWILTPNADGSFGIASIKRGGNCPTSL